MEKIRVGLEKQSYNIFVGQNILGRIGEFVKTEDIGTDAVVITNSHVGCLYGDLMADGLKKYGIKVKMVEIPDGEEEKNLTNWQMLLKELKEEDGLKKRIFIVALGGGVIGDLAGFAAACYRRGINYIQVPTTFLAQVDSGVGGKVGVNFQDVKNLIGTFHQPKMVYADIKVLATLSKQELKSGLAEVIKYGVIYDKNLFEFLEKNIEAIQDMDLNLLREIIVRCYKIKAQIVAKDEFDKTGLRAILNFGHTIGHALEGSSQYTYKHGEAIAIGMVCAATISNKLNYCPKFVVDRIEKLLNKAGLPTKLSEGNITEILRIVRHDKKFVTGKTRFVLLRNIGKAFVKEGVDINLVKKVIEERMV